MIPTKPDECAEKGTDLLGLGPTETVSLVTAHGGTATQARKLMRGLHQARVSLLAQVPNVSRRLLDRLSGIVTITPPAVQKVTNSGTTRKLLLLTPDGHPVETVLFPAHMDPERVTVCVSSQSGCQMGCCFCASSGMGFRRDLTAGEIVGQLWAALDRLETGERINNVVFMGMGEPLANFDAVAAAIRVFHAEEGFRLAYDKITVSTCGLIPGMTRLAGEFPRVNLALSLHATRDEIRNRLVPANRRYPIAQLMELIRSYPPRGCRVFCIEYCLIAGVNDSRDEACELGRLLSGIPHKVHLIPCNPVPTLPYARPDDAVVREFASAAVSAGGSVLIRDSRGQDIMAACGQLGASYVASGKASTSRHEADSRH